jgi:hypothetical protein
MTVMDLELIKNLVAVNTVIVPAVVNVLEWVHERWFLITFCLLF